jgi:hypothetical protein
MPDLTPPSCLIQECRSTSTSPISLPKLIATTSTPPRAPPPLHARLLVAHHLLNRSATDLTAADPQPPLGEQPLHETLAHRVALACMRRPVRKKDRAPSDLNRTAVYRFGAARSRQAAGLGRPGSAPQPRPNSVFFQLIVCCFINPCKV